MESAPRVLVVGAGPTGLVLASELRRHGVPCRIVDKAPGPADKSRAIGVHSRTIEVLDAIGLADELIARGVAVHGTSLYAHGKRIASFTFDELDAPFRFMLCVPQTDTEGLLRAHLERLGGRIEWRTELTRLEHDESGARVELRLPDGRVETSFTPWLVACDGAHSAVRKAIGLPFEGAPYPETVVLADVKIRWHLPTDEAHAFINEDGIVVVAPLPQGRARVIATLPPGPELPPDAPPPLLEELQAILDRHIPDPPQMSDPVWISRFKVHHRLAGEYRRGRVFVVGDAAHIHSPAGGQGMNTGIQDAWNLGWKLALVIRGLARPELLESYMAERRPIAEQVVRGTDATMKVMTLRNPVARGLRDRLLSYLSGLEVVQERMSRMASGIGLAYKHSAVIAEYRGSMLEAGLSRRAGAEMPSLRDWRDFAAAVGAGSRALDETVQLEGRSEPVRLFQLLRGTRHTLLLFDGRASTPEGYRNLEAIITRVNETYPGLIASSIVVPSATRPLELRGSGPLILDPQGALHRRYGAGSECLYLIRPDGYVGFRSQPARQDELLAYLEKVLIPQARPLV